jgi:anti-sigma factor RsiW
MAHVDDGILNALLDGELEAERAEEVRAHLATCAECSARFEEARRFLAEADELLDSLVPPAAEAHPAAAPARPSDAPAARPLPKTAREVAIDIDGSTHKSPAIAPNFPRPGEVAPPRPAPAKTWDARPLFAGRAEPQARRRFDWSTLAWAATIVLAVGLGYVANETLRARHAAAPGEAALTDSGRTTGPAAVTVRPAAPPQSIEEGPPKAAEARGPVANQPAAKPSTEGVKSTGAPATEALALEGRDAAAPQRAAEASAPEPAAVAPAPVGGARALGTAVAARAAPAPPAARNQVVADAAPAPATGAAGGVRAAPAAAFRSIDLDQAAEDLAGTVRWIEGLAMEGVKIGPGSLVAGADPSRDVVRVVYSDPQGRRIQLDQQRLPGGAGARQRQAPAVLGLAWGDTLLSVTPEGQSRLRWLDRAGLWLSLSAGVPADSLRAVLDRIH